METIRQELLDEVTGRRTEGHLDAAISHRQPAVDNVIKGFLAFHECELERTAS